MTDDYESILAKAARAVGAADAVLCIRNESGTTAVAFPPRAISVDSTLDSPLGCLIKPFTATLVLRQAEGGAIDLDDSVTRYVPIAAHGYSAGEITIRDLLRHTSGLDSSELQQNIQRQLASGEAGWTTPKHLTMLFEAGRFFSYSNSGYMLLGHVLEEASRKSFYELLWEDIFEPLGISASSDLLRTPLMGHRGLEHAMRSTYSGASIRLSDLSEFAAAHLPDGEGRTPRLLSDAARESMQSGQVRMSDSSANYLGWSLGFSLFAPGVFGHNSLSGGDITALRIVPSARAALILCSKRETSPNLMALLLSELFGITPWTLQPSVYSSDANVEQCCGNYASSYWRVNIDKRGDTLQGEGELVPGVVSRRFMFSLRRLRDNQYAMIADSRRVALISFVFRDPDSAPSHIWDGQHLTPRVA